MRAAAEESARPDIGFDDERGQRIGHLRMVAGAPFGPAQREVSTTMAANGAARNDTLRSSAFVAANRARSWELPHTQRTSTGSAEEAPGAVMSFQSGATRTTWGFE